MVVVLEPSDFEGGTRYEVTTSTLPDGFYEYKYVGVFNNNQRRIVGDPCARYGGASHENAGFVIGGSTPSENIVQPLETRLELRDLIVYEMMIDDFTKEYVRNRAPIDAVIEQLNYTRDLGFNAIEFMPWTAWPGYNFSWGYNPFKKLNTDSQKQALLLTG
jgi:1,4-alpha-glucan branching enzyme